MRLKDTFQAVTCCNMCNIFFLRIAMVIIVLQELHNVD